MFFRCPREYFLHYYGSAGGHELHAPHKARLLHRLRNMADMPVYIEHLMITVLRELFLDGETTPELFSARVYELFQKEFTGMLLGHGEDDHKLLMLRELTVPGANHLALKSELCDAVKHSSAAWCRGTAEKVLAVPVEQRLAFPMPLPVNWGETICFCTPCAIWLECDHINIAENGTPCEERFLLHAFYAMERYGIAPEHLHSFAIVDGVMSEVAPPSSLSGAIRKIRQDISEMMLPERTGEFYCEEDFSADFRHCENCRFRLYCS